MLSDLGLGTHFFKRSIWERLDLPMMSLVNDVMVHSVQPCTTPNPFTIA